MARAHAEGPRFLAGGAPIKEASYFVKPAAIGDVPSNASIVRDEVFGPLLAPIPFDEAVDAIRLANERVCTAWPPVSGTMTCAR